MNQLSIQIRAIQTVEEALDVESLQAQVWPGSDLQIVPRHLLLTVAHHGGVLLGAYEGDRMVGFVMGFLGTDQQTPRRVAMARLKHCSHMVAVHPQYRGRGIALALKRAQREVLMKQGIRLATWTFDPMMSLNAYLNIRRLGAVCDTYLRDLYGSLEDKLNAGLPSDRFQVDWWITTARVKVRLEESRAQLDLAHYLSVGAQKVNPASLLDDDLPRPSNSIETPQETFLLAEIPPSFQDLKRADPGLALAWRQHGRELFERLFKAGYLVTDFIYLKGERLPRSYYVLTHGEGTLG